MNRSILTTTVATLALALLTSCARHSGDKIVTEPLPNPNPGPSAPNEPTASSDARLLSLELSAGPLANPFDGDEADAEADLPFAQETTTLTAVPRAEGATIEIRGAIVPPGDASDAVPLNLGQTLIAVRVTAPDRITSRTYLVTVRRAPPQLDSHPLFVKAPNTGPTDRFGTVVAIDGDTMVIGAPFEDSSAAGVGGSTSAQADNHAPDAGAVYIYQRRNGIWEFDTYLKAHNSGSGDHFGHAIALDGDTLVVGAPNEDSISVGALGTGHGQGFDDLCGDSGAAYVFERQGGTWAQTGYFKGLAADIDDAFGSAVAVSGGRIAVGLPGDDSGVGGVGIGNAHDNSAPESGAVVLFYRDSSAWRVDTFAKALFSGTGDRFGSALALHGDQLAVGAPGDDGPYDTVADSGAVHLFAWEENALDPGQILRAEFRSIWDEYGRALDMDDRTLVVGAPAEDSSVAGVGVTGQDDATGDSGAVFVYTRSGSTWSRETVIKALTPDFDDLFGWSVAIDGNLLLVGVPYERSAAAGLGGTRADNSLYGAGAAYLFGRVDGAWETLEFFKSSAPDPSDLFGNSVALSNARVLIAARKDDAAGSDPTDNHAVDSGAAFLWQVR